MTLAFGRESSAKSASYHMTFISTPPAATLIEHPALFKDIQWFGGFGVWVLLFEVWGSVSSGTGMGLMLASVQDTKDPLAFEQAPGRVSHFTPYTLKRN